MQLNICRFGECWLINVLIYTVKFVWFFGLRLFKIVTLFTYAKRRTRPSCDWFAFTWQKSRWKATL